MKGKDKLKGAIVIVFLIVIATFVGVPTLAQLIDRTQNPNIKSAPNILSQTF